MKRKVFQILSLLLILLLLAACGNTKSDTTVSSDKNSTAKAFLTSMYTTNKDDRYTNLLSAMESAKTQESLDAATEAFYQEISTYTDTETLDKLTANRIPGKYDEFFADDPLTVDTVELEEVDGSDNLRYTVSAHNKAGKQEFKGEISYNDDGIVTHFWEIN